MENYVQINQENDQVFRFEVKNEAGDYLFSSIPFVNKRKAEINLEKLQSTDVGALIFERKTNYEGKFHFNLKSANRQIIGKSGFFQSKAGMENGIKHLKNHLFATLS